MYLELVVTGNTETICVSIDVCAAEMREGYIVDPCKWHPVTAVTLGAAAAVGGAV